ncbi:MAG TPA: glycosyltransferase [Acidobacteriota bacterium]|jgi:glycosyltransferase involved in cell wall biosynthesis
MRGGEKCLEVFCELFPQAHVFTLVHCPGTVSSVIERATIHTSFIDSLPFSHRLYRHFLPLFPRAIERFDFTDYDLILSSSHCVAKSAKRRPGTLHISYVYTPMRYAWDLYQSYFGDGSPGWLARSIAPAIMRRLRDWDRATAERVDCFLAVSHHVADRIRRNYGRSSCVIHPPVDTGRFAVSSRIEDYYLIVSALVPYKRIDVAIRSFNDLGLPLKIAGSGPEFRRLKKMAGPAIEFLGHVSDQDLPGLYAHCRALVFPGEEDFGIVPLEAQAAGRPVVAYGKGGALETVIPLNPGGENPLQRNSATGIFFYQQNAAALTSAVRKMEENLSRFSPELLRAQALRFDRRVFEARILEFIGREWTRFQSRLESMT